MAECITSEYKNILLRLLEAETETAIIKSVLQSIPLCSERMGIDSASPVEMFISASSIRNVLDAAKFNVRKAQDALARNDFRTTVNQFGVGHEHLNKVSTLAKQLPVQQTRQILESQDYRQLLQDLSDLEEDIISKGN